MVMLGLLLWHVGSTEILWVDIGYVGLASHLLLANVCLFLCI